MTRPLAAYAWLIFKNLLGWLLILAAWPVGLLIPGPGGLPLFLLGFALITFPGKRRLTARVLRSRPFRLTERPVRIARIFLCLILAAAGVWYLELRFDATLDRLQKSAGASLAIAAGVVLATWLLTRGLLPVFNWLLRAVPVARRKVRPWLKRHGMYLLPPRRRWKLRRPTGRAAHDAQPSSTEDQDILEIAPHHHDRLARAKSALIRAWPLLKRFLGVGLMIAIFAWMLRPILKDWDGVLTFVRKTNPLTFLLACGIFTLFLFSRALTWWRILKGFGHNLPVAPATRIWISSELARYVPGSVLQFAGRVFLAKPYGVPRAVTITSQILELSAFLLANVILAVACLLFFAAKIEGRARLWLFLALILLPTLTLLLHPKIFYGIVNGLRARRGKDPIVTRLRGRVLTALLFGSLAALVWQSIAIWLLTHRALHLEWQHWWYVAGAYCLAWIAGFLSFLSPGGLGVREMVFYLTLRAILPAHIKDQFGADRETLNAYLRLLALLLRAWTIVGELLLWALACLCDFSGALGRPDAPGRVATDPPPPASSTSAASTSALAPQHRSPGVPPPAQASRS